MGERGSLLYAVDKLGVRSIIRPVAMVSLAVVRLYLGSHFIRALARRSTMWNLKRKHRPYNRCAVAAIAILVALFLRQLVVLERVLNTLD